MVYKIKRNEPLQIYKEGRKICMVDALLFILKLAKDSSKTPTGKLDIYMFFYKHGVFQS